MSPNLFLERGLQLLLRRVLRVEVGAQSLPRGLELTERACVSLGASFVRGLGHGRRGVRRLQLGLNCV